MIKIAICDDNPAELQTLTALFHKYREAKSIPLQIHSFSNGFSFLDTIDRGEVFDMAILDIIMPGENGIDIAREIRKNKSDMEIIFLTSTPEYAIDSYEVKAQNYLLKPVSEAKFFSAMDTILEQLNKKDKAGFIVYSNEKQYIRILFSQLVYGEAMHKSVHLHLADASVICASMTFSEFLQITEARADYTHPHRSYAVNMNFIQYVNKNEICLIDGGKIPLSRNNYAKVSKQFLDFACSVSFEQ